MPVPIRISERLVAGIKRYQPVLVSAKSRDVNESDTVTIIKDILSDVFGYDKYAEITSEHQIRGTFCDLALKMDGELRLILEAKAIGIELKDMHVKQAVDYAANQGVDWVVLTNGESWRIYRIIFAKPIGQELVLEFSFSALSSRSTGDIETLHLLSRESWAKSLLGDYHTQRQALSRFFIGAMLLSEPVLEILRRELRKVSPGVRIDMDEISSVLSGEVIKRDVLEGEKAEEAKKKIQRLYRKVAQEKASSKSPGDERASAETPDSDTDENSSGGGESPPEV
jgi:hypothetical protein